MNQVGSCIENGIDGCQASGPPQNFLGGHVGMPPRTDDVNHSIRHDGSGDYSGRFDNDIFFLQDFIKNPANGGLIYFKFFNNFNLLSINASVC